MINRLSHLFVRFHRTIKLTIRSSVRPYVHPSNFVRSMNHNKGTSGLFHFRHGCEYFQFIDGWME